MRMLHTLAPAKINVYLRITGRRDDGYHLLDSLMIPISLNDEITVQIEDGPSRISLTCDDPTLPTDDTNLAYRAAALLSREARLVGHTKITLHKRIPAGAGLGGGSSDAAAILKSVNTLYSLGLSEKQLCHYGVQLGADVPFFIGCRPARVTGIGEILTPVPPLPRRWIVLIVPPFSVSTPWAYRRFDELPPVGQSTTSENIASGRWPQRDQLVNDLERAVLPAHPPLMEIKSILASLGAEGTLMTGSGSSIFGLFQEKTAATQACTTLQPHGKVFVVTPLPGDG